MIVPLVAFAVMGLVLGGVTMDILFFSGLMFLGFAMSEMFEKELSVEMTVVAACGMVLGAGLIGILLLQHRGQPHGNIRPGFRLRRDKPGVVSGIV
jgi:Ca2+/Na+ antiporter